VLLKDRFHLPLIKKKGEKSFAATITSRGRQENQKGLWESFEGSARRSEPRAEALSPPQKLDNPWAEERATLTGEKVLEHLTYAEKVAELQEAV